MICMIVKPCEIVMQFGNLLAYAGATLNSGGMDSPIC